MPNLEHCGCQTNLNQPRVSVVIPTFNRSGQLLKAIASVLGQTYPVSEIIVVDDGSTDDTPEVLNKFALLNREVPIIIISQDNQGQSAARNSGIKVATGDLIAFLDDDDVWYPKKIERQLGVFLSYPQLELLGCASNILKLYDGLRLVRIREWTMLLRNWFATPTVVVRRTVLFECGGFPEDLRIAEDYALWLRIVGKHRCYFLNEKLVHCGYGKLPFGHSGVSADIDAHHAGECTIFRRWHEDRKPVWFVYILVMSFAWVRHFRRRLIVAMRTT